MIYTAAQLAFIKLKVTEHSIKEVTKLFNEEFGTNKTYEAIDSTMKRYGIKTGRSGKFLKGHISLNKGVKGVCYEGCKATQFKKGCRPMSYLPIGTENWREDGYLWVKVSDDKKPYRKNWIQKHRLLWEETHGKIPDGHHVMFADQNRENISLDNLMLITMAEKAGMSKNRLFKNNADATRVGLTITKIINKAAKRKRGEVK